MGAPDAAASPAGPVSTTSPSRRWLPWTLAALAYAGFVVSAYLTIVHYRGYVSLETRTERRSVDVGAGKVFLLSDNRSYHEDSRDFGTVPLSSCRGRIFFRLWGKGGWADDKNRLVYIH